MKRLVDLVGSLVGLVVLAPVLAIIALLVKVDSPGPVFYRGVRTGRVGVPFRIFKFRTMVVSAERLGGSSTAKNDPRVTRVGGILRGYKLDELPQLLNVLRGEMSLVGPRPEVEEHTRCYTGDEEIILTARPGITDLASLKYIDLAEWLGSEDADRVYIERVRAEKNALRVKYVRERSFWGDMLLIALTMFSIVGHRPFQPLKSDPATGRLSRSPRATDIEGGS